MFLNGNVSHHISIDINNKQPYIKIFSSDSKSLISVLKNTRETPRDYFLNVRNLANSAKTTESSQKFLLNNKIQINPALYLVENPVILPPVQVLDSKGKIMEISRDGKWIMQNYPNFEVNRVYFFYLKRNAPEADV